MKFGIKKLGRSTGIKFKNLGNILLPMILPQEFHIPVLLNQVINYLNVSPGKKYIDATIGAGGYAFEILKLGGVVLGIDLDQDAIDYIREYRNGKNICLQQGNFRDIKKIAEKYGFAKVDGIIFDLGLSTYQLEKSGRGFAHSRNEILDMRFEKSGNLKAIDILNKYSEDKLYEIFTKYSEELNSRTIAHAIVRARALMGKIESSKQLADIIEKILRRNETGLNSRNFFNLKNKTLSRIYQSLRIAVNNELDNLSVGLSSAVELLNPGARLAIISYHSLEDRIIKFALQDYKYNGVLKMITSKPIVADYKEKELNSKSRSAKLRVAEKL